ncbi:response regulator transcription factor [Desulfoscipio sp. XC116]|uniref:response regulator transcription factor n=1 Tax=Desulfoscipio sp. XC116 TaxID=3144975 RepID=UPI00325B575D
MNKIQLFVLSDNQAMRQGLSAIFTSNKGFEIIGVSNCREDTAKNLQQIQPDVILYGLEPGENVAAIIQMIKKVCPYTKVFVFSTGSTYEEVRAAVNMGIDGCISETMLPCHLVSAIELTCKAGVMCLPWSLKCVFNNNENLPGCEMSVEDKMENYEAGGRLPLTVRELEIYKLIVRNYSNKEIGKALYISQPTVKTHVSSILRKLGLKNRTKVILFEMHNKYLVNMDDVMNE